MERSTVKSKERRLMSQSPGFESLFGNTAPAMRSWAKHWTFPSFSSLVRKTVYSYHRVAEETRGDNPRSESVWGMADAQEVFLPLQPGLITTYQGCGTDAIQRHRKGDQTGRKELVIKGRERRENACLRTRLEKVQRDLKKKERESSKVFRQLLLSITMKKYSWDVKGLSWYTGI